MQLSREEVRRVAELARLAFSEEELERLTGQLGQILEYMERLNELDTEGVPPTHHVMGITDVWREDEPGASLTQEEALSNAPAREGPFFAVPRVLPVRGDAGEKEGSG